MRAPVIRLPLQHAYNVRDLGGYACPGGRQTNPQVFLRADNLSALDEADIQYLLDYGLKTVIDLRSDEECLAQPNPFCQLTGVEYHQISLSADGVADARRAYAENPGEYLGEYLPVYYRLVLDSCKAQFRAILEIMAAQTEGCLLFHCLAGKDRTGMVAMLLLSLAGVAPADIVANYEVTFTYNSFHPLKDVFLAEIPMDLLVSKPEFMYRTLAFVHESYGGFGGYFAAIGLSSDTKQKIHARFVV